MKNATQYLEVINSFTAKRVMVIGDLILDVYLKGSSTRLCPEAPVPVVDVQKKTVLPGGAANTACNLKALGASVVLCTVIGTDAESEDATAMLTSLRIGDESVIRDPSRTTITKTRVMAGSHVITRIDQGSVCPANKISTAKLIAQIEKEYEKCDAVILSDYDKGVITPPVIDKLIELHSRDRRFIAVDSKRLPFFSRLGPSMAKPNYEEAVRMLSLRSVSEGRQRQLMPHLHRLYEKINAPILAVTLDAEGSMVVEKGTFAEAVPSPPVTNPHVAGAGDTYMSAFVLSYLDQKDTRLAASVATVAAAIAIRKECTSACSQAELKSHFNLDTKYISDLKDLQSVCTAYHGSGKRIVFTNGCFDILHSGHVTYLQRARELGDVLIVGMNTDESIKRIKGKTRPINTLEDRLKVLAGLSCVDHIIAFGTDTDDTPIPLIRVVQPHVFAKGGDYTTDKLPEADTVLACGGEIVFLDHVPNHSTTRIITRIQHASGKLENALS